MSWQHDGQSVVRRSLSFSRFDNVIKDYDQFDDATKGAILKVSSSVVSLITRIGNSVVYVGSGTIIECDAFEGSFSGTILTCATLLKGCGGATSINPNLKIDVYLPGGILYKGQVLTYDFYYNIAAIKIKSNAPLNTATMRCIDESISLRSVVMGPNEDEKVTSTKFKLCPGAVVISLARYCEPLYEIMAAPGLFSCDDCSDDCKELFLTTCTVNMVAVGGPLINCDGEVIGVNFFYRPFCAFLPINIVLKCLEDLKKNRQVPRPWLGVGIANLYTAKLDKLEELTWRFPHVVKGAIVEQIFDTKMHSSINQTIKQSLNPMSGHSSMKKGKVFHWTFWSARKSLKAKNISKKIRKKKRSKTRARKIKVALGTPRLWVYGYLRQLQKLRGIWGNRPNFKAIQKSASHFSNLCVDDVIIGCDGSFIGSHLELVEALWNKEGKLVELVVVRPSIGQVKVTVVIGTNLGMNRWHLLSPGILQTMQNRLAFERKRSKRVSLSDRNLPK